MIADHATVRGKKRTEFTVSEQTTEGKSGATEYFFNLRQEIPDTAFADASARTDNGRFELKLIFQSGNTPNAQTKKKPPKGQQWRLLVGARVIEFAPVTILDKWILLQFL